MPQSGNLYRRTSGIYAIRIVVPVRHRALVGKAEAHVSTGSRTLSNLRCVDEVDTGSNGPHPLAGGSDDAHDAAPNVEAVVDGLAA